MLEIESIPTKNYSEVIQINVPVRFYFVHDVFDGIEIGPFQQPALPWQEEMLTRCLNAVGKAVGMGDEET